MLWQPALVRGYSMDANSLHTPTARITYLARHEFEQT